MKVLYLLLLTLVAAGSSKANLGEVDRFEIIAHTETSITLEWSLGPSDQPPIKYALSEDGFINQDVQCSAPCQHTFEFLQQCTEHFFQVTPWYIVNGSPVKSTTAEVNGTTKGAPPNAPTGLVAIDHNHNVDLSWTPPDNTNCLDHWQACYKLRGTIHQTCETTNLNSITLHGLEKCAEMVVSIKGVTPDDVFGRALSSHFSMGYGDPSEVRNLTVGEVKNTTVELKWNDPIRNPLCIHKYSIVYGENNSVITHYMKDNGMDTYYMKDDDTDTPRKFDNHATISDLNGCTIYQFDVIPLSTEGFEAPKESVIAETLESYPMAVTDISVEYQKSPGALIINWAPNPDDACQLTWKICYHNEENPGDECFTTDGEDGETYEIDLQLEACVKYDVGVTGVSPSGLVGPFNFFGIWTWDEEPSVVKDLHVVSTDVNMIEINYNDPDTNAKCVDKYDLIIQDLYNGDYLNSRNYHHDAYLNSRSYHHDDFFTELDACTHYEISVVGLTRTGLKSPEAKVTATTEEGPLSAPRSFSVHDNEISDTSINLVWYEPQKNNRCTGSYKLSWTGSAVGTVDIGDGSSPLPYQVLHTVDELVCGGEYDFTLEAFSLGGRVSSEKPVTYHGTTLPCSL